MAVKYYAVKVGRTQGIYYSWDECKRMVDDFPGAVYKSFTTLEEADDFIRGAKTEVSHRKNKVAKEQSISVTAPCYAFVDGSFNSLTGVYGYGGFLVDEGKKYLLSGSGNDSDMSSMRNVAGEISGATAAVEKAIELGIKELTIYYDYMGIEQWATGGWKRNKKGTIAYYEYMQSVKNDIKITFVKVKGHSGIEGNEEADLLAKKASGVL